MIERIRIPSLDQEISRLGLGCEPLGGTDWGEVDLPEAERAVNAAWDLGINVFDTADVYGLGLSEQRLSEALGSKRHHAFIISKFGLTWRSVKRDARAEIFRDVSPERMRLAVEGSLRRLRLDTIPLYLVHWPDPRTPLEATLEALQTLRRQGKIRSFGLSNFSAQEIAYAHAKFPLSAVQTSYNLISREAEDEILPLCSQLKIGVFTYGPLAQGLLTGKYDSGREFSGNDRRSRLRHFEKDFLESHRLLLVELRELGKNLGKDPSQVAIRWVLDHPSVSCALVGSKSPSQVLSNVQSFGWNLTTGQRTRLSKLCAP